LFSISPHLFTIFGHGNQIIYIIAAETESERERKREEKGGKERAEGTHIMLASNFACSLLPIALAI